VDSDQRNTQVSHRRQPLIILALAASINQPGEGKIGLLGESRTDRQKSERVWNARPGAQAGGVRLGSPAAVEAKSFLGERGVFCHVALGNLGAAGTR
jgi:hypothetical protein